MTLKMDSVSWTVDGILLFYNSIFYYSFIFLKQPYWEVFGEMAGI